MKVESIIQTDPGSRSLGSNRQSFCGRYPCTMHILHVPTAICALYGEIVNNNDLVPDVNDFCVSGKIRS